MLIPHPLHDLMHDRLLQARCGVFVHWGAYESGKTTAVRQAVQRLGAERSVRVLHGYDFCSSDEGVSAWLRQRLSIPEDRPFSAAFPHAPGVLVIDHFDTLFRKPDALDTLRALARDSRSSQCFVVLLVVSSYERAHELIRDLAAQPIGPPDCGRWTLPQLRALWDATPAAPGRGKRPVSDELVERAGTPAFLLLSAAGDAWASRDRADALAYEWENAAMALGGSSAFAPGRFPDRDAVFHFHPNIPLQLTRAPT